MSMCFVVNPMFLCEFYVFYMNPVHFMWILCVLCELGAGPRPRARAQGWALGRAQCRAQGRAQGQALRVRIAYSVCILLVVVIWATFFDLKIASRRPGRHLETFLRLVAPSWLNMSPWRAMATPFVPKMMHSLCSWQARFRRRARFDMAGSPQLQS